MLGTGRRASRSTGRTARLLLAAATLAAGAVLVAPQQALAATPVDQCAALANDAIATPTAPKNPFPLALDDAVTAAEQSLMTATYYCQVLEAKFTNSSRTTISGYAHQGDSSFYTAQAVASEAMRYATMKALAANAAAPAAARSSAAAQKTEALSRIRAFVERLSFDIHISKSWAGPGTPSISSGVPPVDGDYVIANYGGLPSFVDGYPMRNCFPVGAAFEPGPSQRRFVITDGSGTAWRCEAGTSRDTYTGYYFGLVTAFDLVGADSPSLRAELRDDIMAMSSFLLTSAWGAPTPSGQIAESPMSFDGSYSPLFTTTPFGQLWVAETARHVAKVAGSLAERLSWEGVWQATWASAYPQLRASWTTDALEPYSGYYKFNLSHISLLTIVRELLDPSTSSAVDRTRAQLIVNDFGANDHVTHTDLNPWFDAIAYALWGDATRFNQARAGLGDWPAFKANADSGVTFPIAASRCELPAGDPQALTCVHEDRIAAWLPNGTELELSAGSGTYVTTSPRPVAERACDDFLWQRWGGALSSHNCAAEQYSGLDLLLPYWLMRYTKEVVGTLALTPPLRLDGS